MEFLRTRRERRSGADTTGAPLRFDSVTALTKTDSDAERQPPLETGTYLLEGRFRIAEVIGSGGEGVVYRAWDHVQEQYVALKTLHVADASHVPTLKREFRFLRDLIHPSLVQLHELIVDKTLSFFSMALIEGENFLSAAHSEAALRDLLVQLADVLVFLHEMGRVHRDIKATNILVKKSGQLVLVDFGVALNLQRPGESRTSVMGTPRYMAPELLHHQPATEKSDAFSVGVLLFEALTGQHPCASGRIEPNYRQTVRPSTLVPGVPQDLDDLCCRLLEPDPLVRCSVDSIYQVDLGPGERVSQTYVRQSPVQDWFTGRSHELARLEETYERMQGAYAPVVAFVEAQSGMGKTAFIEQFLATREDVLILRSKCSEHEMVPHKAIDGVVDDLVDHLRSRDPDELSELIPESEIGILVQLFPEFGRLPGFENRSYPLPNMGDFRALRLRAYLALAGVLGRLSDETDLIILIDDLHWGDLDSGRLLREVFAGPERPHCLLILAYRSEEKSKSDCLGELLSGPGSLAGELNHTHISLEPLLVRDSIALVKSLGHDLNLSDESLGTIVGEAEGSPLLLTELVSHVRDVHTTPKRAMTGIDGIVEYRVGRLSPAFRDAFGVLCCAGAPLSLGLIGSLGFESSEDILTVLSQARLAHIRKGGQELEVFHDSVREAMLRQLGGGRARYHEKLARALAQRGGDAAEIARHFDEGGVPREASLWAETAAEQANRSFALTRSVELYHLALRDPGISDSRRDHLRLRLATALADLGRGAEAAPLFRQLAEAAAEPKSTELLTQAAAHFLICGNAQQGMDCLALVHRSVNLSWPQSRNASLRFFLWERTRLNMSLTSKRSPLGRSHGETRARLEACRAAWHLGFISLLHASGSSARYLRLALQSGDPYAMTLGFGMEAIYRATAGSKQRHVVLDYQRRARETLPTADEPYYRAFLHYVEAQCHFFLGDPRLSIDPFEKAESVFSEQCRNVSWELNSSRLIWTQALSTLGRLGEWGRRLSEWNQDAEQRGDMCLYSATKIGQGRLSIITDGDPELARRLIAEGASRWEAPVGGVHYFTERFANVYIDAYCGRADRVLERLAVIRREMDESHMNRVQLPRVQLNLHEAFACVELAADEQTKTARARYIQRARAASKRLFAEKATWAEAFATQIQASCDLLDQPNEEALRALERAEQLFASLDLRLHRAAVCARIGELRGGDEGRRKVEEGRRAFAAVGAYDFVSALSAYTPRILPR